MAQRVALVTGANRGIGLEIARGLVAQGMIVVATARGESACGAMLAQCPGLTPFSLDVTQPEQCQALRDFVAEHFGRLDVLVNNAGVALDQWVSGFELEMEVMRQTMEVNLYAPLQLIQRFIPMMRAQGYGRIVNVSSELASLSTTTLGSSVAYRCSKAALNALTKLLACELKDSPDILVNAAAPGWCRTALGGEQAPRSAAEGADTCVWLATLAAGGPSGGFFRDRAPYAW